jgi:serine/threonine protein kinase/Tol biopolymer transport system component
MSATADCPLPSDYQRLVRGELPPAEIERLSGHLEGCDRCAAAVHTLLNDDTALDAVRQARADTPTPKGELPAGLFQRLCALKPPPSPTSTATGSPGSPGQPDESEGYAFLAPAQTPHEIGRLGSYRVLRVLGSGGMGVVFEAEDSQLRRKVALKVMKPSVAERPTARQRFLREARAAAAIEHDHIVPIYQVGEDRGVPFLAMQLLAGTSLDALLRKAGRLKPAQVVRIGRQVAEGLAAAHERGLVHRDIKPGNIWIESAHGGRVKILDFGLARPQNPDQEPGDEPAPTDSGAVVGTPSYMAPEQARGEKVDSRADLFSLGCVLYELATGKRPFAGTGPLALLTSLALDTPRPPADSGVPAALSDLILRLLAKDPAKRPASAAEVARQLAELERKSAAPLPETSPRRRRILPWVAAAGLLATAALVSGLVVIVRDKQGKEVARVEVPPDGKVEVVDPTKGKDEAKEQPPLPPPTSGEPMSGLALVRRPAQLKDVPSWTIETKGPRSGFNAAYSADGKRLATFGGDGTVRIWDTRSGELVKALIGPFKTNPGGILAWSPDGKYLASTPGQGIGWGGEAIMYIWDVDAGRLRKSIPIRQGCLALVWSPDGNMLAAGTAEGIDTYDAESGAPFDRLPGGGWVWQMAWSPDGTKLAALTTSLHATYVPGAEYVCVWDVKSARLVKEKLAGAHRQGGVFWSRDGDMVITTDCRKTVQFWDGKSGQPQRTLELHVPKEYAGGAVYPIWSEDGKTFTQLVNSAGYWDAATGKPIKPLQEARLLRAYPDEKVGWIMAWSPDGKQFMAQEGFWDATTGKRRLTLPVNSWAGAGSWSPDGKSVAVAADVVHLWNVEPGMGPRVLTDCRCNYNGGFSWSPDSKRVLYPNSGSSHCVVIDIAKGDFRLSQDVRIGPQYGWSADGKDIATVYDGRIVVLEESRPGAQDWTEKWHNKVEQDTVLAWSPTDNVLATGNRKCELCLWDGRTGAEIKRLEGNPGVYYRLA